MTRPDNEKHDTKDSSESKQETGNTDQEQKQSPAPVNTGRTFGASGVEKRG